MAEYIEREALLADIDSAMDNAGMWHAVGQALNRYIKRQPAADVVEVPCRCKDCKHWMDFPNCGCTDFVKVCALAEYMIGANGYCLYGERKDGE